MSASSASTTIRSAFPFTLSPTVNCHDIFDLPQRYVTNERSPASTDTWVRTLSLCTGGWSRRSARTPICTKIEGGADAGARGITCYMVRPTRASCVGISQQWRASLTDGNSVTPAQVTSIKVKDESINLTALANIEVSVEIAPSPEVPAYTPLDERLILRNFPSDNNSRRSKKIPGKSP